MSDVYRFRVGTKRLGGLGGVLGIGGYNHACILLNRDLFEYGVNGTWERHRNVGRDPTFDWSRIGDALNGTTYVSPDQLEAAIRNSGKWGQGTYNFYTHNCHDFVQFCLDRIGCPGSMIQKIGACYHRFHFL